MADTIILLVDMAGDVARRQQAAGLPTVPRNAGNRRTQSKQALLAAIDDVGGRWQIPASVLIH